MAGSQPELAVVYTDAALDELDVIATWNEKTNSREHARRYIAFLEQHIDALSTTYLKGKPVEMRPELRYILLQRKTRGHGHVAVYSVDGQTVNVLHIFHTVQDWRNKLLES